MNLQDIQLLYDYNYWANGRILTAAAGLSPAELAAPNSQSYGSLRGTLVHILDAEWGWRNLLQHNTFTESLVETIYSELPSLEALWREEEKEMRGYLAGLRDEDLAGIVRYTTHEEVVRERVLWHCLVHVVNHGTQHRSEAAVTLTDYNRSPGDVDFTIFINEQKGK